ncbi:MAG: TonB-dependent receptor [Gammaproteobacteria bacterium]|nr:TonB-dependent receptor [Gammaproteobacteria bacterium]
MYRLTRRSRLCFGTAIAVIGWASVAWAQQRTFNIPSESAAASIPEFARQAGIRIVASPAARFKSMRTPAVEGALDTHAALSKLLSGTGIVIASDDGRTIVLKAPPAPPAKVPAALSYGHKPTQLGAVVVTASKRSESIQNVPGQVTALTSTDLKQIHANTLNDVAALVPGLSYQSTTPGNNLIAIRGVTTGGGQLSSGVGLYLDQVPIGASTAFGLGFQSFNVNLYDLDRVEVLNGPQGTDYGANALGGAIKYVTNAPNLHDYSAEVETEGSTTKHGDLNDALRAKFNVPLFGGKAALRVAGVQQFDSGYVDDPSHGRKNQGAARTLSGRVELLVKPTSDFNVRLTAFTGAVTGSGFAWSLRDRVSGRPVSVSGSRYEQSFALPQPTENSLRLYSAVANLNLHWAKLTSVSGYQLDRGYSINDESGLFNAIYQIVVPGFQPIPFALRVNDLTRKFTQELRLASPDNHSFEWMVGAFFTRERTDEDVFLVNAADPKGQLFGSTPFGGVLPSRYREISVFGNGTIYFSDNFDVTLGIRRTHNWENNRQTTFGQLVLPGDPFAVQNLDVTSNEGVNTYLLNPRYHLSRDIMFYARVSRGFRPGGANFIFENGLKNPNFKSDTLWNYEIGEKSTLLDGKLTLNADLYDLEWQGIQTTVNTNGVNQLANGGDARVRGAELAFRYLVLPGLTVSGSGSYSHAFLTTVSPLLGLDQKDVRLPLSPRVSFALTGAYEAPIGNDFSAAIALSNRFVGNRTEGFSGSFAVPKYQLPAYDIVNLDTSLFMPRGFEADLYVHNVFDTPGQVSAITRALGVPAYVALSQPRTIGLVLKASFDRPR